MAPPPSHVAPPLGIAHPIQKFLSYSHLSPTHKHFCSSISPIVEPTSYA